MIEYDFTPRGVCSRHIHLELSDDGKTIQDVQFTGGCAGNLEAIRKLTQGKPTDEIVALLQGNPCGRRPTSCADQMTKALLEAQELVAR